MLATFEFKKERIIFIFLSIKSYKGVNLFLNINLFIKGKASQYL